MFAMCFWIQLAEMQLQWAMGAAPEGENPLQLPKKLLAWKLDKHCLQHFDKTHGIFCIEHASRPVQAASCRGGAKECAPRGHKVTRHLSLIPFPIVFVARICPVALRLAVDVDEESELHILVPVEAAASALNNLKWTCSKDNMTQNAPVEFVNLRGRRPVAHKQGRGRALDMRHPKVPRRQMVRKTKTN